MGLAPQIVDSYRPTFGFHGRRVFNLKVRALVRQLRLEKGMSQERLAELCGLHRNYIGAIERAERTPSIVTAERLAKALDLTLSGLFLALELGDLGSS